MCVTVAVGWHCGSSGHCVACVDWYGFNLVSLHILSSLSCLSLPLQFSVSGGLCTACLAGQFSAGNVSSCSSCVAGTFSAASASTCTNCSAGTSSVAQASSCSACGSGQVRVVVHRGLRRHVFLHCGVSSSIVAGGDAVYLIALACTMHFLNSCVQYSVSGGLCLQCLAGQFSAGNVSSCSSCVAGRFSGGGASSCTNCTAGSSSGGQASSCSVCGGGQVSGCLLM